MLGNSHIHAAAWPEQCYSGYIKHKSVQYVHLVLKFYESQTFLKYCLGLRKATYEAQILFWFGSYKMAMP
jgi:hypothetical protein